MRDQILHSLSAGIANFGQVYRLLPPGKAPQAEDLDGGDVEVDKAKAANRAANIQVVQVLAPLRPERAEIGGERRPGEDRQVAPDLQAYGDRKSTRLNSSHLGISYA